MHRLERIEEAVEENRKILRALNRARKWGIATKIAYWVFIVAIAFGAYYYVEPYVGDLFEFYSGAKENVEKVGRAGENLLGVLPD